MLKIDKPVEVLLFEISGVTHMEKLQSLIELNIGFMNWTIIVTAAVTNLKIVSAHTDQMNYYQDLFTEHRQLDFKTNE